MIRISRIFPLLALALCWLRPAGGHAQAAPLDSLDAYIQRTMPLWEVPGLAIAVVKDDSVIFARGYGVRELGRAEPVDAHTLFAIASTTKAMTAAALGMLVDEGELSWDDPVTRHLPGFQVGDSYLTREFTVRDLLTHRSGLGRMDNLWIASPFDRAEIIRRARFLPEDGRFRADYGYHNIMFITAGEAVGAVSGTSWDDFVARRIFQPLGMTRSTTRADTVAARANVSASHTRVDGRVIAAPPRDYDEIGGAGAAFSSAREMAQWIRLQLGHGSFEGRRLIADSTVEEMHTPQTIIRSDSVGDRLFPDTHFRAYGLGWVLQDYKGRKLVHHSGYLNWTRTQVGMIPSVNVGVVVISKPQQQQPAARADVPRAGCVPRRAAARLERGVPRAQQARRGARGEAAARSRGGAADRHAAVARPGRLRRQLLERAVRRDVDRAGGRPARAAVLARLRGGFGALAPRHLSRRVAESGLRPLLRHLLAGPARAGS